jgi:hypothetical protein
MTANVPALRKLREELEALAKDKKWLEEKEAKTNILIRSGWLKPSAFVTGSMALTGLIASGGANLLVALITAAATALICSPILMMIAENEKGERDGRLKETGFWEQANPKAYEKIGQAWERGSPETRAAIEAALGTEIPIKDGKADWEFLKEYSKSKHLEWLGEKIGIVGDCVEKGLDMLPIILADPSSAPNPDSAADSMTTPTTVRNLIEAGVDTEKAEWALLPEETIDGISGLLTDKDLDKVFGVEHLRKVAKKEKGRRVVHDIKRESGLEI